MDTVLFGQIQHVNHCLNRILLLLLRLSVLVVSVSEVTIKRRSKVFVCGRSHIRGFSYYYHVFFSEIDSFV